MSLSIFRHSLVKAARLTFALTWLLMLATAAFGDEVVLPKPEPPFKGKIGRTVKDSAPDFPKGVTAPEGAPNVHFIMTDDVGLGATSSFGGPVRKGGRGGKNRCTMRDL